jgi:tetratricopeptide (TPR) repeat protein
MSIPRAIVAATLILALLAVCSPAQEGARDDENLIRGLLRDKLYEVAADKIFDFVFKYPQHPRRESLLFDICNTLLENGKEAKAVPLLRCYLQEFPEGPHRRQSAMMLARAETATGDYSKAIELLRIIVNDSTFSSGDQAGAREMLAGIYLRQQRYDGAASLIEGVPAHMLSAGGRLTLARSLRRLGRQAEAETVLKNLLTGSRQTETWRQSRAELAALYVEMARYQDCLAILQDWTPPTGNGISDLDRAQILALASSYYHLGDYERAFRIIQPLANLSAPSNTNAGPSQREIIGIMLALNEWASAAELLAPLYSNARDSLLKEDFGLKLVDAYIGSGHIQDAITVLEELAGEASRPDRKAALLFQAAKIAENDIGRLALLDKALQVSQKTGQTIDLLFAGAAVLERVGKTPEALQSLAKIVELGGGAPTGAAEALIKMADIHKRNGALKEAEEALSRAAGLPSNPPTRVAALERLVRIRILIREWRKAAEAFSLLRSIAPVEDIPEQCWFDGAAALAMQGEHGKSSEAALQAYLSGSKVPENRAERVLILMAEGLYHSDKLAFAEAVYAALLQSDDSGVRLAAASGFIQCALADGRFLDAIERCRSMAETAGDPWSAGWARFTMAGAYGSLGDVSQKQAALLALARDLPDSPFADAALRELERMALDAGMFSAAVNYNPLFNTLNPQKQYEADRLLIRAQKLVLQGDFTQASNLYRAFPKSLTMPTNHRFLCAKAFHKSGNSTDALRLMLSIDPELLQVPQRRERDLVIAEALVLTGKPDDALKLFRGLLAQPLPTTTRLDTLFGAAQAAEAAGRWADEKSFYSSYLEQSKDLEPDLKRIEMVAASFAAHGEFAEAANLYRRLMILAKDSTALVSYSFKAASMSEDGGELEAAAEEFLKIAYQNPDLDPWPARCRLRAAAIYERLDRPDAAERQYSVVAEKYPETEEGRTAAQRLRAITASREAVKEEQLKTQPPPHN